MNIYTVKSTDIVHNTSVDLITRWYTREVHIVQYDNSQPIVAVKLFKNSDRFVLPDGYEANLRFGKKDRTFIYKPVLGCNQDRDTVYFAVDEQMSMFYGKVNPIIEFTYNGAVVGSSSIPFVIDRNPIQIGDVESKSDYPAIIERISAKQDKLVSGTNIKTINGNSLLGTGDITINAEDLNPLKADITALKADVSTLKTDNTQNKTNISNKQDTLVSGTNIKTINGESILGSGNIAISGGSGSGLAEPWSIDANFLGVWSKSSPNLSEDDFFAGLHTNEDLVAFEAVNLTSNKDAIIIPTLTSDVPLFQFMSLDGSIISMVKLPEDFFTRSQTINLGDIANSGGSGSGLSSPWVSEEKCIGITDNQGYYSGLINMFGLALYGEVIYDSNSSDQPPLAACVIGASCEPENDNLIMFSDNETNVNSYVKLPKDFKTRPQTIILGESTPLYSHTITLKGSGNSAYFTFTIYMRTDEEVTKDTLFGHLDWNVCAGIGVASNALIDKIDFNRYADSTWVHQFLELSGQRIDKNIKFDSVFGTDFTVEDVVRGPDWIPPR